MSELLELKTVSLSFGGLEVNRNVSFKLHSGDRVALIGPNGAGKTTLINVITGHLLPTGGSILLEGTDVTRLAIAHRVRRGLARTFQVSRLFRSLTVAENVALAVMQRRKIAGRFFSAAARQPDVRTEWDALLGILGINSLAQVPIFKLAYGQQRLVEIAIGVALRPKVLLLDEPAAGVPHDEAYKILAAIGALPSDIAILMIEHDMDLVFRFAKKVLVLSNGRLIFEGSPEQVAASEEVRRAYLGTYADVRRAS